MSNHTFTFMGTGAGCGVPAFFCECPACNEARALPRARRGDCGVMVQGESTVLIDTPPDTRHQLIREHQSAVDTVLFTHAHFDHLGGLGEFEYMTQLKTGHPLPVYGSPEALATVTQEFHYMTYALDMHQVTADETVVIDDVRYTALPVRHAPGTFGYLIETASTTMFYASDTGALPSTTAERIRGADIAILDATFWKENPYPQSHNCIQEVIEEVSGLGVGKLYLTHLSMHYPEPVTLKELEAYLTAFDGFVEAASDGLKFQI